MRITFLPHALEQMRARGISEVQARLVLEEPDQEGEANFGRLYAQKEIGHRRIRVVYNRGADETVALRHAPQKGRWSVVRISHDKISGALYIKLREGEYDHTEDFSEKADVYLDVNAEGDVLGLEALSFEDLAQAIEGRGGKLEVPDVWDSQSGVFRDSFLEAMSHLSPRKQELLHLLYMEGLTTREAAKRLGVSVSTAYRLQREALGEVRVAFERGEHRAVDDAFLEAFLSSL